MTDREYGRTVTITSTAEIPRRKLIRNAWTPAVVSIWKVASTTDSGPAESPASCAKEPTSAPRKRSGQESNSDFLPPESPETAPLPPVGNIRREGIPAVTA